MRSVTTANWILLPGPRFACRFTRALKRVAEPESLVPVVVADDTVTKLHAMSEADSEGSNS